MIEVGGRAVHHRASARAAKRNEAFRGRCGARVVPAPLASPDHEPPIVHRPAAPEPDPDADRDADSAAETPQVVAAVERGASGRCVRCQGAVCGHEVVLAWVLGFKDAPRCAGCLAKGLGRVRHELIASVKQHVDHRDCWSAGWRHASSIEVLRGVGSCAVARAAGERPTARHAPATATAEPSAVVSSAVVPSAAAPTAAAPRAAHCYDAGDLGCGDLVLELRLRLRELAPGALLEVIARDPGAPADLPAWCGLTGHTLLEAAPPRYLIRRRPD